MDRRRFLKTAGAGALGMAALGKARRGTAAQSPEVVVIGAGAFGGWTALHLREAGARVTLLDAFGPGNSRASSGGETRQIRAGYGERKLYSRWVLEAFDRWRERESEWGRKLLFTTGRLQLSQEWTSDLEATKRVLDELGVENHVLREGELRSLYPQMSTEGIGLALWEPGAGVLRAREACRAVAEGFEKKGGRIVLGRAEPEPIAGGRMEGIRLAGGGDRLAAEAYVFACGPWLRKVFPELLGPKLYTPRRDVFFFGTPSGDERFTYPNFPNYSEADYYGFPSFDYRGFKVCPVGERTPFDPDGDERLVAPHEVKRARDYLARRFPALREQPILETRVCQLEMSVDEHFIIDRHPEAENVWIAGGGSGHGFKHGPVVGAYVANRVLGGDRDLALESVFRLKEESF